MRLVSNLVDRSHAPPIGFLRQVSAHLTYPLAQRLEGRSIGPRIAELRRHYAASHEERRAKASRALAEMLAFAGHEVPYYRDLFGKIGFDPEKVASDPRRLEELPLLTKQIIAAEGDRLLSRPLAESRHHAMTTGGSTGTKATIYYDQAAADHSAAVTVFARSRIGAWHGRSMLHFAAALPDTPAERWPNRETFKGLAMNRSNIFFSEVDDSALQQMWDTLHRRRPFLVHGHPSTLHALADYGKRSPLARNRPIRFSVFESSGEVLDDRQRQAIAEAFGCVVVDRYGLAEFGVIAYEFDPGTLEVLDSECWIEPASDASSPSRLVVTGLRNRLMPLIRYDTGDLAVIEGSDRAERLGAVVGRVHDTIEINGVSHLTHYVQDVLDHRVRGIKDFQIDSRTTPPVLRIVLDDPATAAAKERLIEQYWPGAFSVEFVQLQDMIRVGDRAKFRHVVTA